MTPPTDTDREFIDKLVRHMTPSDLMYVANGLALLKDTLDEDEHLHTVCKWADLCATKNPNFNRDKFYEAAGIYIPPPEVN